MGDPDRLAQVVSNLLTNAAKYTPAGGQIRVAAAVEGEEVVLSVRDTGIGIAGEMLPRIFDLFTQDRQAIDRAQGGLGLRTGNRPAAWSRSTTAQVIRAEQGDRPRERICRPLAKDRQGERFATTHGVSAFSAIDNRPARARGR